MKHPHAEKILNPDQEAAVHFGVGPLLIIAGAGTGKTTVVTERIKHLITSGLAKPQEILALTFTEKAAREMEERVDIAMPYGYTQMWIATFHSFCDRILRADATHIGLASDYKLLSDTDITMLMRKHIFSMGLDYFRPLGNPTKFISGLLTHFSRLMDEDVNPSQYLDWVKSQISNPKSQNEEDKLELKKWQELAHAYQYYEDLKIKEGFMDFSNLIGNTLRLFRTRKNILKEYQKQFKFLLVDEFQDTNVAQNQLIVLLAGGDKNITAVADDDQSIYKFRGAAVSNVIAFRKHFPKAKLIVLSKNYRSTQTILDRSYNLIQHNNPDRLEVKEGINKKLFAMREIEGKAVQFLHFDRIENEAEGIGNEIKNLKSKIKNLNWSDVAILVRANNHAEPFVRAFTRLGIPFQFLGPGQLFRQPEIKELISYLQLLANITDTVSLYKVLTMDFFAFSIRDLGTLTAFARRNMLSLFEACELAITDEIKSNTKPPVISEETRQKLKTFVFMVNAHLELVPKETAGQILFAFLQDSGMLKSILTYTVDTDEKKATNITKFFNKLKSFEAEHEDASVSAVLDWILLSMELGESPAVSDMDWVLNDAVNILTVHSAKGLEFKVVFLVNLVSLRFPTTERRDQIPIPDELIKEELPQGDFHEEEERRLFYVGMTRARDLLYLTAANFYGEGKREKKISPFVYEALGEGISSQTIVSPANQLSLLDWQKKAPAPSFKKDKIKISYLSYSQIETFTFCPLHYKLRYLLNIPTPPSPALSFGASIHATLKDFYEQVKQGTKPDEKLLLDLMRKNWSREGYQNRSYEKEMYKRGETYLKEYLVKGFTPHVKTLLLEQPFTIPLSVPGRFLRLGGRLDRVDKREDGMIEIIDYKTGRLPSKREMDTSLQLSVYAIAATEIKEPPFDKPVDKVLLSLYYFDSQEKVTTIRTEAQLAQEKKRILEIAKEIENSDFHCSQNKLCATCEYKMFCGLKE